MPACPPAPAPLPPAPAPPLSPGAPPLVLPPVAEPPLAELPPPAVLPAPAGPPPVPALPPLPPCPGLLFPHATAPTSREVTRTRPEKPRNRGDFIRRNNVTGDPSARLDARRRRRRRHVTPCAKALPSGRYASGGRNATTVVVLRNRIRTPVPRLTTSAEQIVSVEAPGVEDFHSLRHLAGLHRLPRAFHNLREVWLVRVGAGLGLFGQRVGKTFAVQRSDGETRCSQKANLSWSSTASRTRVDGRKTSNACSVNWSCFDIYPALDFRAFGPPCRGRVFDLLLRALSAALPRRRSRAF